MKLLEAKYNINSELNIGFGIFTNECKICNPHYHDFFEIIFFTKGSIYHIVNNDKQLLTKNCIVFIRPHDVHSFNNVDDTYAQYINIPFSINTFNELITYLDINLTNTNFLTSELPPLVYIPPLEADILLKKIEKINYIPYSNKNIIKASLRIILLDLIQQFLLYNNNNSNLPVWLNNLCVEMQKKENFTNGITSMLKISNKTHQHICRNFKKYINKTPTEFINELKLNYATNMLINSDIDILSLALDSGFSNFSHFYNLFKKQYGTSPSKFRKKHRKKLF